MWAFKSLWDKGLIYEGFRVLAYCWRCETPLSNTETRMDDVYRDRQDPALTVGFELLDGPWAGARLLAWTTTPWTLPANLALAVGPDIDYAVVEHDGQRARPRRRPPGGLRRRARRDVEPGRRRCAAPSSSAPATGRCSTSSPTPSASAPSGRSRCSPATSCRPRRAPASCTWRRASARTTRSPATRSASRRSCRWTSTAATPPRSPDWAGEHVFDANPHIIRRLKDDGVVAAPRDLRPPVPALLALRAAARLPGDLVVVRRGHQVPRPHGRAQRPDHLGARAPQARQLRQVAGERPRLVDQPQPLLGLADPGVAQRRPELPAGRRLRLARRAGGRLRRARHRPAPPDGRRARPAQPRRPDRPLDDAPRARGARLLVRVGVDAVRPGALPVREPRVVRGPLPGRLHRRVHRPDPRLVLHAARAGHGAVRPPGVPDVRQPRHRARLATA